jgi:hypothetical protein
VLKYAGATGVVAAAIGLPTVATASPAFAADPEAARARGRAPLDVLVFGDARSEKAHQLTATLSDTVTGGLGQSARVLNPTEPASYAGGTLRFEVAVSPTGTTYVTVRLWGDDFDDSSAEAASGTDMWRLQLFCEGKQVGHQDQGAVDNLDILDTAPRTPGRFFFHTLPGRLRTAEERHGVGDLAGCAGSAGATRVEHLEHVAAGVRLRLRLRHGGGDDAGADGVDAGPALVPGERGGLHPHQVGALGQDVRADRVVVAERRDRVQGEQCSAGAVARAASSSASTEAMCPATLATQTSEVPWTATFSNASITYTVPSRSTSRMVRTDAVAAETPAVCTTVVSRPASAAIRARCSTDTRSETSVRTPRAW